MTETIGMLSYVDTATITCDYGNKKNRGFSSYRPISAPAPWQKFKIHFIPQSGEEKWLKTINK